MSKKINRKIVCTVLFKSEIGNYHRIYQVEGDKPADSSLYFVSLNHLNKEVIQSEEDYRRFCLQKSFHDSIGFDGLAQTHMKRDGNHFGGSRRAPLSKLNYVLDYSPAINDNIESYPTKTPEAQDILLILKPKYFSDYQFIFYKGEKVFSDYRTRNDLILLHNYNIPTVNTAGHKFAVAIKPARLSEIQSRQS